MSLGLYMDVRVPAAVTRALVLRGVDVLTVGGVIYAHQLSITIGRAVDDLELLAKVGTPEEFANRVEFLPL